jgi:hypothetical protein
VKLRSMPIGLILAAWMVCIPPSASLGKDPRDSGPQQGAESDFKPPDRGMPDGTIGAGSRKTPMLEKAAPHRAAPKAIQKDRPAQNQEPGSKQKSGSKQKPGSKQKSSPALEPRSQEKPSPVPK